MHSLAFQSPFAPQTAEKYLRFTHLEAGEAAGLADVAGAVEDCAGDAHPGILHRAAVGKLERLGDDGPAEARPREASILGEGARLQRARLRSCLLAP